MEVDTVRLMEFRRAWTIAATVYAVDDIDGAEYRRVWADFAATPVGNDPLVFIMRTNYVRLRTFKEARDADRLPF